jgi:hypothetical protein
MLSMGLIQKKNASGEATLLLHKHRFTDNHNFLNTLTKFIQCSLVIPHKYNRIYNTKNPYPISIIPQPTSTPFYNHKHNPIPQSQSQPYTSLHITTTIMIHTMHQTAIKLTYVSTNKYLPLDLQSYRLVICNLLECTSYQHIHHPP